MQSDRFKNDLFQQIQAAQLEELPTSIQEADEGTFMDIIRDIVTGDTTPEDVESRLIDWANKKIDVPLLTERMEEWALQQISDVLVSAAMEVAESYLDIEL